MFRRFLVLLVVLTAFNSISTIPTSASPLRQSAVSKTSYSKMEIMFAQAMIPHHRQAITMSQYALKNSNNSDVIKLARGIIRAQKSEITQMTSWIKNSGASESMNDNMGMAGMLDASQLSVLKNLKGRAFDKGFLGAMIKHHSGALQMVPWISASTKSDVKKLAKDIKGAQTSEIIAMKAMLAKIGK